MLAARFSLHIDHLGGALYLTTERTFSTMQRIRSVQVTP